MEPDDSFQMDFNYSAHIARTQKEMEVAEEALIERGEISCESWLLVRGFIHAAIVNNMLRQGKAIVESTSEASHLSERY